MTELRRLTGDGIKRARDFLAHVREHPRARDRPPQELLFGERYSRAFESCVEVEPSVFRRRRDAAEYLAPRLEPIKHRIGDDAKFWSWLGMYYFEHIVRIRDGAVRLSRLDETFVVDSGDPRSLRNRYRHYLWGSWRLYEQHGEGAAYLLNEEITSWSIIADRGFGAVRIFNSEGVIQLILRLYTEGGRQKPGSFRGHGGLRHLVRVLDQLELTHDVYGMQPDALIEILPEPFRKWDNNCS